MAACPARARRLAAWLGVILGVFLAVPGAAQAVDAGPGNRAGHDSRDAGANSWPDGRDPGALGSTLDSRPEGRAEFDDGPRPGGAVEARAYVASGGLMLGQVFTLIIAVSSADPERAARAELPTALSLGPAFDVGRRFKERRPRDAMGPSGQTLPETPRVELELELIPWRVGAQTIPAIPVVVPERGALETVFTAPVPIQVAGPALTDQDTLRDHLVPVAVTRRDASRLYLALAGLIVVLMIAVSLWLVRARRRRAAPRRATTNRPQPGTPAARALEKLRALADSGALEADDLVPVFHAMAEIVRDYLSQRFAVAGRDSTTAELLAGLARLTEAGDAPGDLPKIAEQLIGPWLERCDLVKFAGARPSVEDAILAYRDAVDIVCRTAADVACPVAAIPDAALGPAGDAAARADAQADADVEARADADAEAETDG